MASVNKVILIGHLGKDPEVRYMPSGKAVAHVTIATSDRWKDRNTGEKQERIEWHHLTFYSPLAEIAGQYLRKGSSIFVEGRLQYRQWQDQTTGQDRYATDIVVNEMKMLGSKSDRSGGRAPFDPSDEGYAPPAALSPTAAPAQPSSPPPSGPDHHRFDDDIPFVRCDLSRPLTATAATDHLIRDHEGSVAW